MSVKDNETYVVVDGFTFTLEEWNEIKDSYCSGPTYWEIKCMNEALQLTREVLFLLDNWIKQEDYDPDMSSDYLKESAHSFCNSGIFLEVVDNDYTTQEQYLEILCGITNKVLENKVILLLQKLDAEWLRIGKLMMH